MPRKELWHHIVYVATAEHLHMAGRTITLARGDQLRQRHEVVRRACHSREYQRLATWHTRHQMRYRAYAIR